MALLMPMSAEAYAHYFKATVLSYARENVKSSRWPEEGVLARSQVSYDSLLPQGLEAPGCWHCL